MAVIVFSLALAISAEAANGQEPVCTVYASLEEQKAIINATMPELKESVVSSSVTPVYYYTLYDFSTKKEYKKDERIELSKTANGGDTYYYVASVKDFSFFNEQWSGALLFYAVKNGEISVRGPQQMSQLPEVEISMNYADYAEHIRVLSGRKEIISPRYVRLVHLSDVGWCFYVNDGIGEFFYLFCSWVGEIDITHGRRIIYAGEELESAAEELKDYLESINPDEAEQSGGSDLNQNEDVGYEFYRASAGTPDIEKYFGIKVSNFKTHFPEAFAKPGSSKLSFIPVAVPLFVAAVTVPIGIIIIKKDRKKGAGKRAE